MKGICKKIIEPSLLSINKEKALDQLKQIKALGLELVHYDVMDGKFVPPTSFTNEYLDELEKLGIKPNIHLMVQDPDAWIERYKHVKAKSITFHAESQSIDESLRLLSKIRSLGFLAGFSVKPHTDLNKYSRLFDNADIVLIMSVEPGWGGQGFVKESLNNLAKANEAKKQNPNLIIEIDGGINIDNMKTLYNQVDWFVTGSWFFKNIDHMDQYLQLFKSFK